MAARAAKTFGVQKLKCCAELLVAGLKGLQLSSKTTSVQKAQYYAELFVAALKVLTVSNAEFISFLTGATAAKTLGVQKV